MRSKGILAIGFCFLGATAALGQTQVPPVRVWPGAQSAQDPGEKALLAKCKVPPPQAAPRPAGAGPAAAAPAPGPRDYTVTEIPGVIAAGQKWQFVWQQMGNNGDGILGTSDGGLMLALNDSSTVVKLDKNGNPSVVYFDTNTGGALSMSPKGELFVNERGLNSSIVELTPTRRTLVDSYNGDPMDCIGTVLNDLTADSKGGAYFSMGGLYYASPSGVVTKYGEDLHTNGIILSPDEKTLYVTNGPTIAAFDVQPDSSLTNQRVFGKLEGGGSGDGSTVDAEGRLYVTTPPGVQVLGPDGKYLGLIPTPRGVISVAFSGPDKKQLFILARGATNAAGVEVANAAQVYSIQMIAQGYKKRAK